MASSDAEASANGGSDAGVLRAAQAGRGHFLALVAQVRPELHRYCARMTGSVADGEDVVQDTLARAWFELADLRELPPLRPWLFRIAHNRAVDFLRAAQYRRTEALDEASSAPADTGDEPEQALERADTVRLAVTRFLQLPATQRSCVILKDVLEHSLDDITQLLGISLPAAKAALHRGRARLGELQQQQQAAPQPPIPPPRALPGLHARYAALFNARDWDGVRALLLDDVKLDLVDHLRAQGREAMHYFSNYDRISGWRLAAGWLDGGPALAVFTATSGARPGYFIQLTPHGERVSAIRDFRYVPYIAQDAVFEPATA